MRFLSFLLFALSLFGVFAGAQPEKGVRSVSLCSVQDHPERFLNAKVEVDGLVFAGVEYPRITAGNCSFRFANGDDYQTFGERFPVHHDEQWTLLKKLLGATECASNVRVAKARITGTVIRVPATGTIPEKEMPFELVIQSVSEVEHVQTNCTPQKATAASAVLHESGHVDPPKPQ